MKYCTLKTLYIFYRIHPLYAPWEHGKMTDLSGWPIREKSLSDV